MNSDNSGNNQISPIARMNDYGNYGTILISPFKNKEIYRDAFYGGHFDGRSEYCLNTTAWD